MQKDAAHRVDYPCGDLEELESNGSDLSALKFGADETRNQEQAMESEEETKEAGSAIKS